MVHVNLFNILVWIRYGVFHLVLKALLRRRGNIKMLHKYSKILGKFATEALINSMDNFKKVEKYSLLSWFNGISNPFGLCMLKYVSTQPLPQRQDVTLGRFLTKL